jgi:hypothetical protein
MPRLTRWFLKVGLLYLLAAGGLGSLMLMQSLLGLPGWLALLRPVYLHLFMVGWVTQLIFGIVFWMFPKLSKDRPRGSERLGWAVFALLNAGLLLRAAAEPLALLYPGSPAGGALVLAALLQWVACLGFVANTWGRVKER